MIIPNKEIGEIWAKAKLPIVIDLIHTMVDKQTQLYHKRLYDNGGGVHSSVHSCPCELTALNDYGIELATWRREQPWQ
jgi:hypothetical protein